VLAVPAIMYFFALVEYDNLSRLGITDVQSYLKRRFKRESIVYLKTCCAGPLVVDNLEAAIDEALSSGTWLDVMVKNSLFLFTTSNPKIKSGFHDFMSWRSLTECPRILRSTMTMTM
jgi:hypothetical protein